MLEASVALERIEIIARFGSLDLCNDKERQVVLALIMEIAEDTRRIEKHKIKKSLESDQRKAALNGAGL
ncbi:hypothetical protein QU814_12545 [Providencia rettgeri]|uniref:hypothetical protein n=1 Tax=Providencia rettgeri TaxID=587 RepID=UPI000D6F43D2|nr:hypothetical protein [Providencia rettgeri]MDM9283986.1 hypothetical protein [Providencia rettgeri]